VVDELDTQGYKKIITVMSNLPIQSTFGVLLFLFISQKARYLIFKNETGSDYRIKLPQKRTCTCKCTTGAFIFFQNKKNKIKNLLTNYLKFFSLPTSPIFLQGRVLWLPIKK
jgi:hypothetical protein